MSPPGLVVNVNALYQQIESMKDAEHNRHEFVENLMQIIQNLNHDREETIKALRAKEVLANTYQDRFEAVEKQIDKLKRAIDCDMFVLVVIDGDNTLFKDDYVRDGLQGGERAARDLQQALMDYFNNKQYFRHDYKIVTKIYLNLTGLSRTYSDAKIVPCFFYHHQQDAKHGRWCCCQVGVVVGPVLLSDWCCCWVGVVRSDLF